jgi:hypothetical protein
MCRRGPRHSRPLCGTRSYRERRSAHPGQFALLLEQTIRLLAPCPATPGSTSLILHQPADGKEQSGQIEHDEEQDERHRHLPPPILGQSLRFHVLQSLFGSI